MFNNRDADTDLECVLSYEALMAIPMAIEDMSAAELSSLLSASGTDLSERQATALHSFVQRIGGIQNALAAVEMLRELEQDA